MKLRPHHLLCTQGYEGKGYSEDFVKNMTAVTDTLRGNPNTVIEIVFSTDDICDKCPNMLGPNLCSENDKVKRFDEKLISYFGLREKSYVYRDIVKEINSKMTEQVLADICCGCGWYPVSACKNRILPQHVIRQAVPEDSEAILNIYAYYIENTAVSYETETPSADDFRRRVESISATYPFLVYLIGNEIVGYAYAATHRERAAYRFNVDVSVYISQKHHGRGIGSKLYERLFRILYEQGFYNAYAVIGMPNEKSRLLHAKFGFNEVGIFHKTGYKLGEWHDVLHMEKAIRQHAVNPTEIKPMVKI